MCSRSLSNTREQLDDGPPPELPRWHGANLVAFHHLQGVAGSACQKGRVCYGNESFYLLFRLHAYLYDRWGSSTCTALKLCLLGESAQAPCIVICWQVNCLL